MTNSFADIVILLQAVAALRNRARNEAMSQTKRAWTSLAYRSAIIRLRFIRYRLLIKTLEMNALWCYAACIREGFS